MKINVEFDLTPEEFRRALGLPDVEAFQQELLNRIQKQMESGVEGYDPMSLMKPFLQQGFTQDMSQGLSQGLASFGTYQQMMLDMLRQAGSSMGKAREPAEADQPEAAPKASGKAGTASARSRSRRSE
ncbi:hypothetical protein HOP62_19505 [Halomonas sp. MCCC 1A17488]|uniref:Rod binding protein n=1 Tax=Billgrantia sulfidoxydans TaxID=2733484 RepID=A0ABX7W635_9GAMM|nr:MULTISPECIES: DUF6489 family protein [Halomonas]MCE8018272.1 hypothetical protein [Halomonas sp. MCCC 1A17488]MCG3241605.1 hypothetical protein [Halomonas sp. MCCC 1A17488]QPP48448.1 hypothetical protein I4484_14625 [Halomonas sp. SS10-MC5]QTP55759.1 hypothetical protein HNO51_14355 [Halomonas sulfidoxydans]